MSKFRKGIVIFLSVFLVIPNIPMAVLAESSEESEDEVTVPEPLYHWGFETQEVDGTTVSNQINKQESGEAELNAEAKVVEDESKGNVLQLPGNGWLTLPDNLYEEVSDELTLMIWAKVDEDADPYSRLFSSTITEKYKSEQGVTGSWSDPEISIVAGNGEYNQLLHKGTDPESAADYRAAIQWEEQPVREEWQHITLTMKSDGTYRAYFNGEEVTIAGLFDEATEKGITVSEAVEHFFEPEHLDALIHNDIGRSLYTSDNDIIGYFDDIQVYNQTLTTEQVLEVVNAEAPSEDIEEPEESEEPTEPEEPEQPEEPGLKPLYHWGFEAEEVDGDSISNQVNEEESGEAKLNAEASVVEDERKGKVLQLPGDGWLTLPDNLYEEISDELTITVWANVAEEAEDFSRLFASTITEKHKYNQGESGSWADPEFSFVAGSSGGYQNLIQIGTNPGDAADYRAAIMWEDQITRDSWQHVAITMKNDGSYDVYLDGQAIGISGMDGNASDDDANLEESVEQFFERDFLDALTYNDFGRSIYTSDGDITGSFDDIQVFNKALTAEQVLENMGSENDATLKNIFVGDDKIAVDQQDIRYETTSGSVTIDDITVETSSPEAEYEVVQQGINTFEITVTSPNEMKQLIYTLTIYNPNLGVIANFDMNATNGEIMHGASGFLYGVSEPNVPTIDLLEPLKPQSVEQKPPEGLQHPTGDGIRVADTYFESGTQWIQLAVPDMYLQWPYEYEGLDHYEGLVRETVQTVKESRNADKIVYVIFNEPNGIWFSGNLGEDGFLSAWERMYNVVKEEDPDAKIAGPNLSHYDSNFHEDFVEFAVENDVIPDQFTWHELSGESSLSNWDDHFSHYRGLEEAYGFERPIVINEYSNPEDPGAPGRMIQWLSRIENSKVYGSLAYWHSANSLNELAADTNKPNGAWWLYKWYGDMTGQTVDVETYSAQTDGMYGLTSIDDEKGKAYTIFGGEDGVITTSMENLTDTDTFNNAESVHVKLYRTKYTGFKGSHEKPRIEFEGNMPLVNGNLNITVNDADALDGYHAIVTPATNDTLTSPQDYERIWTETYEAEDAELNGVNVASQGWGAVSNEEYVRGLNSSEKNVTFNTEIPTSGKYKLEVFYGNAAPLTDGKNRAQGELANQLLKVNGENYDVLTYDSTVDMDVFASKKLYLDLDEGANTLQFSQESGMEASLDKIDLTYVGEMGQELTKTYQFEAEEASYNGFHLEQTKDNFSGAGYIQGSGENQYTIVVEDNGYYDLELGYASDSNQTINVQKRIVNYPSDATAEAVLSTEWSQIASYDVEQNSDITSISGSKVYLTAGANSVKVSSNEDVSLDYLKVDYDPELTASEKIEVEAESGELIGEAEITENEHTSGENIVTNIGESKDNGLSLTVDVEEAGAYKLAIDYINDEPAPVIYNDDHPDGYLHPYNTDLVERYAQVEVNSQTPQTVYFKNTLSWDTVKNHVIDINLDAGENTITFYNDNSYRYNDVVQYAPHFDKFEIWKSTLTSDDSGSDDKDLTSILVNPDDLLLKVDETTDLDVTAEYSDDSTVDITDEATYSSSDEDVVTITSMGEVQAKGAGKAQIEIHYQGQTVKIDVKVYRTQITIGETIEAIAGEIFNIEGSKSTIQMPEDLPVGTTVNISRLAESDVDHGGYKIAGDVFDVNFTYPSGESFTGTFILSLEYDSEQYSSDEVFIYYLNEDSGEWELREGEADNDVITLDVSNFSTYGVFAEETDEENDQDQETDDQDQDNDQGQETDDQDQDNDQGQDTNDQEKDNDKKLPETATSMFNWLVLGFVLLIVGVTLFILIRKKHLIQK